MSIMSIMSNYYVNGSQSASNCAQNSQGYEPFMLGNSYGVGVSSSTSGMKNRGQGQDCLNWSSDNQRAGNAQPYENGNQNFQGNHEGMVCSGVFPRSQSTMQFQNQQRVGRPQSKKYLNLQGNARGQGEGQQTMTIPCRIAPLGTNPASMLKPLEAVTYRVSAPAPQMSQNGSQAPMTFTINPQDIYRGFM